MSKSLVFAFYGLLFVIEANAYLSSPRAHIRSRLCSVKCQADSEDVIVYVDNLVETAKKGVPARWLTPSPHDVAEDYRAVQRLPLPGFELESVGIRGRWVTSGDNFVLRPLPGVKPLGVIHFIGGAFVGSAPHLAYRYLLDEIADEGYVVVATPYKLTFNYVELCADIVARWQQTESDLEAEFGRLPVIGLGHSCGSVLQILISSLFPEFPRDANVLISFNNKAAKESIPNYENLVIPFAKTVTERGQAQIALRELIERTADQAEKLAYDFARSPLAPAALGTEVLPIARETMPALLQVSELFQTLGSAGAQEFTPAPPQVAEVLKLRYPACPTLVVKFDDDSIDESEALFALLDERRRRLATPAAASGQIDSAHKVAVAGPEGAAGPAAAAGAAGSGQVLRVTRKVLRGNHLTPLLQDLPTTPLDSFDPLINLRRAARGYLLAPTRGLQTAIVDFLRSVA